MNIGCCIATLADVPALEAAGADYYELPIARTVMAGGGEVAFAGLLAEAEAFRLRARAYNVFLPPDLPVVGPAVDHAAVEHYAEAAFARVRRLGGGIVVFGSGRSRSVPDGFDSTVAFDQLEAVLRLTAGLAARSGATLAVEPLRRSETNVLNTVGEAATFIRRRGLTGVQLLADLYHMMEEEEPFEALDNCADLLVHVHVAGRGRRPPGFARPPSSGSVGLPSGTPGPAALGRDAYDLTGFLRRLRQAGYRGDCSIECKWADFPAQVGPSVAYVRAAARAAGWAGC